MKKAFSVILFITILACFLISPAYAEDNWSCPSCGNAATGNFCNNCGSPKPVDEEWICSSCGNEASGNYCNLCGMPRPTEGTSASMPAQQPEATPAPTPEPTPLATPTPLPAIASSEASDLLSAAINHTLEQIKPSPDRYTYYINDYVGLNLSSIGYTSMGGDRYEKYGAGLLEICPIALDGTYIDIEDDSILSQYVVVGQNIAPNTEMKLTYKKDSKGKEYSNLIDFQTVDSIDLLVTKLDGTVTGNIISYTPIAINPSPDKYTAYVKNYVGKNLANVGYVSMGGDLREEYNAGNLELILVTEDGTYIDIEDKDLLQQYVVIGQNYAPNTEIKIVHKKDSKGNEYDNLVESMGIESIDLQVARIDGTTYNDPVPYEPIQINTASDRYTQYVRNYTGKNLAFCGYTSMGGKRMDQYGQAYIELSLLTPDRSVIDLEDIDQLKQYIVVSQDVKPNTKIKITFRKDSKGKEYDNLVDSSSVSKITLTLKKINTLPEATPIPVAINTVTTTAAPAKVTYTGQTYKSREFTYVLDSNGNAIITGYTGTGKTASVPSDLDGHDIGGIGASAFEGHSELTDILLWGDPSFIGERAFMGCTKLKDISLPNECEEIGASAFENCTSLTSVIMWGDPEIGDRAFYGCSSLKDISIGNDTKRIGVSAFEGCTKLSSVLMWGDPEISARAFFGCSSLKEISIGNDTEIIGESAFEGCTSMKSVLLWGDPNIEARAFYGCTALKEISIGYNTEYIGDYAFYGCTSLKEVTLWGSKTRIGTEAFGNCPSLKTPIQ